MNATINIETLAAAWLAAKAAEDTAKAERYRIEKDIAALLPAKDEGTAHADLDGLKLAVTYKLTRKVDADKLQQGWNTLPATVQAAFSWKPDVSITQLRALEKAAPQDYATALQFITTSPANKPSIKVEQK